MVFSKILIVIKFNKVKWFIFIILQNVYYFQIVTDLNNNNFSKNISHFIFELPYYHVVKYTHVGTYTPPTRVLGEHVHLILIAVDIIHHTQLTHVGG